MPVNARKALAVVSALLLLSGRAASFEISLSDNSVREAYFLGQRTDQKCADFLNLYRHRLPVPEKGPYVSEILLLTPFAQVVAVSNQHTVGYSSQQAAADYRARGDTILIQFRVELMPTFTFSDAKRAAEDAGSELNRHLDVEEFWRAFRITVSQANTAHEQKTFEASEISAEPMYSRSTGASGGEYLGTFVSMEFDASKFGSLPTRVELVTPTGGRVVTDFDLANLR